MSTQSHGVPLRIYRASGRGFAWSAAWVATLGLGIAFAIATGIAVAIAWWLVVPALIVTFALVAIGALLVAVAPSAPLWARMTLVVLLGHLLLNYGFANAVLAIGPVRAPLSELVLVIALVGSGVYLLRAGAQCVPATMWLFLAWLTFVLGMHVPRGFARYGIVALRDALPTVQMLYLLPGFVIAHMAMRHADGARWTRRFVLIVGVCIAVYGLAYPLQKTLLGYSPRVTGMQQAVPLVGYFASWPQVALTGICGVLLWGWARPEQDSLLFKALRAVLITAFGISFLFVQSRGGYVTAIALLVLLLLIGDQARTAGRLALAGVFGVVLLFGVSTLGLELRGRVGNVTLESAIDHLTTLSGRADSSSDFQGAAGGIVQRRMWREQSLRLWRTDLETTVFGIGYGQPLTNFTVGGTEGGSIIVREPHNSYVTILTRLGVTGIVFMLLLHGMAFGTALRLYRKACRYGDRPLAAMALGTAVYFVCNYLNAIGQPNFENPHFAVPYFFLAGVTFSLWRSYESTRFSKSRSAQSSKDVLCLHCYGVNGSAKRITRYKKRANK
ncbi:MAG: O-antigen ligase family protein [Burkholderiaceae bacterium]|nr:O-antigen ligase family protein [Burkholderiaceae bacterium]